MSEVIKEQIKHRETHGVEHHPDVARRSGSAKRSNIAKARHAVRRVEKADGWVEREELASVLAATTIAAAINTKQLVKRKRDGVWGYAIPGSEPAVEDATSRVAAPA